VWCLIIRNNEATEQVRAILQRIYRIYVPRMFDRVSVVHGRWHSELVFALSLYPRFGCKVLWSARLCMSVSPREDIPGTTCAIFTNFLRSWLGPPLTKTQYVMYFRFCGWCHLLHNVANRPKSHTTRMFRGVHQVAAQVRHQTTLYDRVC